MIANPSSGENLNTYRAEILILVTLHISAWGCLIRSDYNFIFLFFGYFYLISKKDYTSITIIFFMIIGLQLMDIIFFIFVPKSWMTFQQENSLWNNLRGIHGFAIFIAIVIFVLKLPLLYFLYNLRKQAPPVQK